MLDEWTGQHHRVLDAGGRAGHSNRKGPLQKGKVGVSRRRPHPGTDREDPALSCMWASEVCGGSRERDREVK